MVIPCISSARNFYVSNSGGESPIALGVAMALKMKKAKTGFYVYGRRLNAVLDESINYGRVITCP